MKRSNCNLLIELLKLSSIKIDKKELEFQFQSHPSYPSLHALTGVLNHFKIPNMAIEVPRNAETLKELPHYFLAHINHNEERLVLVKFVNGSINLYYDKKQSETISIKQFLEIWSGVIVVVEKDDSINTLRSQKNMDLKFIFILLSILSIGFFFWNLPNLFQQLHFSLSVLGFYISILLVQHDLGIRTKSLEKICSGKSEKVNCEDVLQSKEAMIFGKVKWSDIGLTYFGGITLAWLLIKLKPPINDSSLLLLTVCALPFTLYSIYLQLYKLKKWCPLCLSILAILWMQGASLFFLPSFELLLSVQLKSLIITGYCLLFTYALWKFMKSKLEVNSNYKKLSVDYNRFKRNYKVFNALLHEKTSLNTSIDNCTEIVLGNKDVNAPLKIIVVTNPLCGHCKNAHKAVIPLLASHTNQIQVTIRFNVNIKDEDSVDTRAALTMLAIYQNKNEHDVILALDELYSTDTINTWLKKWERKNSLQFFSDLRKQKDWCILNNIDFTPEILLNGISYPAEYERDELKYFIDEMVEELVQVVQA